MYSHDRPSASGRGLAIFNGDAGAATLELKATLPNTSTRQPCMAGMSALSFSATASMSALEARSLGARPSRSHTIFKASLRFQQRPASDAHFITTRWYVGSVAGRGPDHPSPPSESRLPWPNFRPRAIPGAAHSRLRWFAASGLRFRLRHRPSIRDPRNILFLRFPFTPGCNRNQNG